MRLKALAADTASVQWLQITCNLRLTVRLTIADHAGTSAHKTLTITIRRHK